MSLISRLGVVLGLDSSEFNAGLGQAKTGLNNFSTGMSAAKIGIAALGTALVAGAREALQFADEMTELAKANEMSVASVLEMSSALSTAGGKLDNTAKILSAFTNKVDEAAQGSQKTRDKFKELGVSLSDLGKLSEEDLLRKTIKGLSEIEDPIRRNALAFDLLGKGIRGVDLKDFNADLEKVKGTYDKSEESFRRIEQWGNTIAKAWFDAKVAMANFMVAYADAANKEMEMTFGKRKYSSDIEAIFAGGLPGKSNAPATSKFTPIDTTGAPSYKAAAVGRATPLSDEDQKRAEAAQKIRDAMKQQSLEYQRQLQYLGETQTNVSKLMIEFEKGGKYAGQQNTELGKRLILDAQALDNATKARENAKAAYDLDVAHTKYMQEQEEKRIKFRQGVDDISIAAERMEYEKQLAGLSDTQTEKALAFFDLRQKIMRMTEDTRNMTAEETAEYEKQLEVLTQAEQRKIESTESLERYKHTFQYGWDKAWANFKERATDSAAMAGEAFNSMARSMESALDTFVRTGKLNFGTLAQSIIADLIKIQLRAQMSGIFGMIGGNGGMIEMLGSAPLGEAGSGSGFMGWLSGLFRAEGGSVNSNQPYIVGERGAELFVPNSSGTIIPNNTLASAMGSQPQIVYNGTVIQNMNAIDTQSAVQFLAKNKDAVWAANQSAQRSLPMSR